MCYTYRGACAATFSPISRKATLELVADAKVALPGEAVEGALQLGEPTNDDALILGVVRGCRRRLDSCQGREREQSYREGQ